MAGKRLPDWTGQVDTEFPNRFEINKAWRVIYKSIMWCHVVNGRTVPHIIDRDRLEKAAKQAEKRQAGNAAKQVALALIEEQDEGQEGEGGKEFWYEAGCRAATYLTREFGLASEQDLSTRLSPQGQQNVTSSKFEGLLGALINRWFSEQLGRPGEYCRKPGKHEVRANVRGYRFHPANALPSPDLMVPFADPQAVLSLKWSLRDDHISQMVAEAAALHSVRPDICVLAVTNEFDLRRLLRLANEPQILKVYHLNRALLNLVHRPEGLQASAVEERSRNDVRRYAEVNAKIFDLTDLFKDLEALLPSPGPKLDTQQTQMNLAAEESAPYGATEPPVAAKRTRQGKKQ